MSFTSNGWYLLSTTTEQTMNEAMVAWGISTSTPYKYIYELKNAPILASPTVQLTADNWTGTDIITNHTFILKPMKAYWVNIQTLILDLILSGTGELNNSTVTSKLQSTSSPSNVIIQDYTNIGANAFSGATTLKSIIIPSSVTSVGGNAFQNTPNLSTVTVRSGSQLTISSIVSNAFSNSGLKTVIFESISNLESLGFKIINTPQIFFGATSVQVLPTKAAVQTALTDAFAASSFAQGKIEQLTTAVTLAEIPYNQAQREYENAQQTLVTAQRTLQNTTPQFLVTPSPFFPNGVPNPAYTTAYNNVFIATVALGPAQSKANMANAQLTFAKANLNNATEQVTSANDLVTKLRAAQSWAV